MGPVTEKKVQSLFSIAGDMNVIGQIFFAQSMQRKLYVIVIVFHQQNFDLSIGHDFSPAATALEFASER